MQYNLQLTCASSIVKTVLIVDIIIYYFCLQSVLPEYRSSMRKNKTCLDLRTIKKY